MIPLVTEHIDHLVEEFVRSAPTFMEPNVLIMGHDAMHRLRRELFASSSFFMTVNDRQKDNSYRGMRIVETCDPECRDSVSVAYEHKAKEEGKPA